MDDIVAQFMSVTSCDGPTAQQYLDASDWQLEQAVELFFASGGASIESQSQPITAGGDEVRERIEGFDDQLVDEEAQMFNEVIRNSRRAEARARKPRGIFNQNRDAALDEQNLSRHEKRLADLFRPPFDLISDISLDEAKEEAQLSKRLVMVNIQDSGEFSCQRLNRDLWRSQSVKEIVAKNFVFLQYDADEPDGEDYRVLYPFESFPHISILDPWTGEQQKVWSKVPEETSFIEDVVDFVASTKDETPSSSEADPAENRKAPSQSKEVSQDAAKDAAKDTAKDPIESIAPLDAPEPPQGPETTRIQLRFGNGKRTVRRFLLNDPVEVVYGVAKHVLGVTGTITLTSDRRELKTFLDKTIDEANLKNSTILVET